ncbi:MAG: sodium:alanine symporter family protein [Caedimonadaceae bacterium]|nr:MAG: sodium:alanine symporter family protein [Caedimonadaceae bacterium]
MFETFKTILGLFVVLPFLAGVGLYLSIKLRWLQLHKLPLAFRLITRKSSGKESISSFGALSAVLGGNLGTGNISGIAVAIATGGPGSLFWMWIMALFGAVIKFAGCFLGLRFRQMSTRGGYVGGPMYYFHYGLNRPFLAKLFCVLTLITAVTVGGFVQINSITLPFFEFGVHPAILGLSMAVFVGYVILGGLKRFAKISMLIVPLMAVGYLLACFFIMIRNLDAVVPAIKLIVVSAFDFSSLLGGVAGYSIMSALKSGFERGLFATDSGVGLAPILHAPVTDRSPGMDIAISQGLISMISPIIVMIVCTLTGIVLLVTGVWQSTELQSTTMCVEAFRVGFDIFEAGHLVTVTLFFFAFTTILTWSYCADRAVEYLFGEERIKYFQYIFIALIPVGAFAHVNIVWSIADVSMSLMMALNVIGVVWLSPIVIKETRAFFYPKRSLPGEVIMQQEPKSAAICKAGDEKSVR